MESNFPCDNAMYKVVMIKDLSDIYKSCDMQLNIFCSVPDTGFYHNHDYVSDYQENYLAH